MAGILCSEAVERALGLVVADALPAGAPGVGVMVPTPEVHL